MKRALLAVATIVVAAPSFYYLSQTSPKPSTPDLQPSAERERIARTYGASSSHAAGHSLSHAAGHSPSQRFRESLEELYAGVDDRRGSPSRVSSQTSKPHSLAARRSRVAARRGAVKGPKAISQVGSKERRREQRQSKGSVPNPYQADRWLSGAGRVGPSFAMEHRSYRSGCLSGGCERPEEPKDMSLLGIVVKSEGLNNPTYPLVEGHIRQGHFIEKTPAVYVE